MSFVNDVIEINKFGFEWIKDKKMLSFYPILAVLYFIVNLIAPADAAQLFTFQTTGIIIAFAAVFVILAAYIALQYMSMNIMRDVLAGQRKSVKQFTPMVFIELIILSIAFILAGIFSVFELKWLALLIIGTIFATAAYLSMSNVVIGIALGAIAGICLFVYFIIMMRNLVRLSLSPFIYLEGAKFVEAMASSWNLTCTKALKIFVILLVAAVITGIISLIFALPQMLAMVGDALFNLVGIPIHPLSAIIVAIYSPAVFFIQTFVSVKAYEWVLAQKAQVVSSAVSPVRPAPVARAPAKNASKLRKK